MIGEPRPGLTSSVRISILENGNLRATVDDVAGEEPLEIRVRAGGQLRTAAVTMRTPGHDFELAAGFLYNEGIVASREAVSRIEYCVDSALGEEQRYNIVTVDLSASVLPAMERLERHFTMTSACGVCGKASIDALRTRTEPIADDTQLDANVIAALPNRMREAQRVFASTGGLHAAALFRPDGTLVLLREDVGRHNALDKICGWSLMNARMPLRGHVLLVSGRASYELVQKCAVAGIPILCAVSAPSSLAVRLADEFRITLLGFVRDNRANIYTHINRIV